ncbi:hypothetical protein [Mesorhizobium sp.]|uniref:hypothetical protein n=1 Tax=Mesorhizobium sp. TaxID=1871066 RepID=UPI000FE5A3A4|nr:hypothetical protein [Mesorhizobium sp.]RWP56062.1 MAG: hypothetical protein EOR08_33545 [Mesorhizobium sp.]
MADRTPIAIARPNGVLVDLLVNGFVVTLSQPKVVKAWRPCYRAVAARAIPAMHTFPDGLRIGGNRLMPLKP